MLGSPRHDGRDGSSYDAVDRARWQRRASRLGGDGAGGFDEGLHVALRVMLGIFVLVAIRLVWFQVIDAASLSSQAELRRTNIITLTAKRGAIYDRNGNVLAISRPCKDVYCNPKEVSDATALAGVLAGHLGGTPSDYLADLTADTTFVYIRRKVDDDVADALREDLIERDLAGIYYIENSKRTYPYGAVAGQVLGVVGTDGDGLSGLELLYDDILRGTDGQMVMETGATGTPIAGATAEITDAKNGTDIVISLDVDIQQVAERAIAEAVRDYEAESGSVMVYDPRTGAVLAACSTPLLDLTDLSTITDEQMALKPVVASYEPGSIFKVLTAAIGIDNGLVSAATSFSVPAEVRVGDDAVHDDDGRDYTMDMDLREMMRRSSNCGLSLVAQQVIGATTFARGVESFGVGSLSGIDFPGESPGLVRSLDEYDGSSLGSMAFGQGLAMPMVQMVRAVGAIANAGVLETPHFLLYRGGEQQVWDDAGQAVAAETAIEVTDLMRTVVEEGTATAAQVPGYDVAGKTGTGEQADERGGYKADSFVASLIGFAPASAPEVLVYVGLNGTPYLASGSAAPTFAAIMGEALTSMGVRPTSPVTGEGATSYAG